MERHFIRNKRRTIKIACTEENSKHAKQEKYLSCENKILTEWSMKYNKRNIQILASNNK